MTNDDATLTTPASLTSAKPGLRIKAKILDFLLILMTFTIVIMLTMRFSLPDNAIDIFSRSFMGLLFLYLTLSEGLWGTTIGKKIYKVRVIGPVGEVPGILIAFLRNFVIILFYFLFFWAQKLLTNFLFPGQETKPGPDSFLSLLVPIFLFVLCSYILFSTARQKNGYAGLHDLISDTRVVFKP